MADIYGSHFEYGGVSSRQYDLIIANLNTSRWIRTNGEYESVTIYSKIAHKKYLIDDNHADSPVTFDIEILAEDDRSFGKSEMREIEKWLFNNHNYRKLYFDIEDDPNGEMYETIGGIKYRNYLNCRFMNPERIEGNGGVTGFKATLEADSNMFWQDVITKQFSLSSNTSAGTAVVLEVDTDFHEYIYPKVTITVGSSGGDIVITNTSDDSARHTKFVGVSPRASIVMKGELNYVSGDYYKKFSERNFIRLLDGENRLMLIGDISSVKFEYSARRMM